MENKYFVPDIEDIRVGYECEYSGITESDDGGENWFSHWKEYIVDSGLKIHEVSGLIALDMIRVPYLTKEQIEAEGWFWWGGEDGFYRHKESESDIFVNFDEDSYRIKFRLGIGQVPEWTLYDGECKDINTFRYICKLLKICA